MSETDNPRPRAKSALFTGVVGAIATMGVIVGTDIPMFMGAMIMGPLGGWSMRKVDSIWDGKIEPGFEMLVNNFAAGIWGMVLTIVGFVVMSPVVTWISDRLGEGVNFLVNNSLLPFTSIIIEPAKVLLRSRSRPPKQLIRFFLY